MLPAGYIPFSFSCYCINKAGSGMVMLTKVSKASVIIT